MAKQMRECTLSILSRWFTYASTSIERGEVLDWQIECMPCWNFRRCPAAISQSIWGGESRLPFEVLQQKYKLATHLWPGGVMFAQLPTTTSAKGFKWTRRVKKVAPCIFDGGKGWEVNSKTSEHDYGVTRWRSRQPWAAGVGCNKCNPCNWR